MLVSNGWCRIEGATVKDTQKAYGYSLTSPIKDETIFYGLPSVQIYNKTSAILGVAYKVVPIKELCGYETVKDIDAHYNDFIQGINNYNKVINTGSMTNAAQMYYKEFTIDKPSVIFYDDTTQGNFRYYAIVYVDEDLAPPIVNVSAKYIGNPVPVDLAFDENDLRVYAYYEDGNLSRIVSGYEITPSDRIVKNVGVNTFDISFKTNDNYKFVSTIAIQGVKRLVGLQGTYDGPSLYKGQSVERKFLVVVALYSDGSSATVTSYTFPNGNVLGYSSFVEVAYNGERCNITIPTYEISTSRLVAYYTGPNIEVDSKNPNSFDTNNTTVRIYYQSKDGTMSNWEDVPSDLCTFTPTVIEHEGNNEILVQYTGKNGPVSCYMLVPGFKPGAYMTALEAKYTGPDIVQGKTYSLERLIVKAYYSDGSVVTINNGYRVNSNIVEYVGINNFSCTYTDRQSSGNDKTITTTFTVKGLAKDSTTESNYNPISLINNFPEATRYNNRYRGPAEALKHYNVNMMIFQNIHALYQLFADIEHAYNNVVTSVDGDNAIKYHSLNQMNRIQDGIESIMADKRFIKEDNNE
jgi:hypothetical protein